MIVTFGKIFSLLWCICPNTFFGLCLTIILIHSFHFIVLGYYYCRTLPILNTLFIYTCSQNTTRQTQSKIILVQNEVDNGRKQPSILEGKTNISIKLKNLLYLAQHLM